MTRIELEACKENENFSLWCDKLIKFFEDVNRSLTEYNGGIHISRYYEMISVTNKEAGWVINIDGPDNLFDIDSILGSFRYQITDIQKFGFNGMSIELYVKDLDVPDVYLCAGKPKNYEDLTGALKEKRIKNLKKRIQENKK